MNKPIQDLQEEHGGIMQMLKVMDQVAGRIKSKKEVNKEHLDQILEYLTVFADKCHHGKEEEILFPELLKNPSYDQIVNELLGEHMTGRDYIRGIAESVKLYNNGNPHAYHIAVNMHGYIQLLTEHIQKENILFIKVDKGLPPELQRNMEERFEVLENNVVGSGKHEMYHDWLHKLKDMYLL